MKNKETLTSEDTAQVHYLCRVSLGGQRKLKILEPLIYLLHSQLINICNFLNETQKRSGECILEYKHVITTYCTWSRENSKTCPRISHRSSNDPMWLRNSSSSGLRHKLDSLGVFERLPVERLFAGDEIWLLVGEGDDVDELVDLVSEVMSMSEKASDKTGLGGLLRYSHSTPCHKNRYKFANCCHVHV